MNTRTRNSIFIATSIDGYIADKDGKIDFLHSIPNPEHDDMGYADFMQRIDAIIMGRNTFETVCGFEIEWPYSKPVFVLSRSLKEIPSPHHKNAQLVQGELEEVLHKIHAQGYHQLYIDGGQCIQSFFQEDLIDEMIVTQIPVLLGGGIPLFGALPSSLGFRCIESKIFLDQVVQNRFIRSH